MLLRNTFSNTKKFFGKTFQNFKSLVSGGGGAGRGYQRIPKTPPFKDDDHHHHLKKTHQSFRELDDHNFYTNRSSWEESNKPILIKNNPITKKKTTLMDHQKNHPMIMNNNHDHQEEEVYNNMMFVDDDDEKNYRLKSSSHGKRDETSLQRRISSSHELVKQKMKELVLMMDLRDVDHMMDVEEMLHYYSRLTSPVYLDIVDRFFMELYFDDFFLPT